MRDFPDFCAFCSFLFIKEPKRGAVETIDVGGKKREGSTVKLILKSPTMIWLILSGALHNFNMYALGGFITPYLMRHHGLDIAQANYAATIIYGLLSVPGLLLGGLIGDWAKRKRPDGALLIATFAILAFDSVLLFLDRNRGGRIHYIRRTDRHKRRADVFLLFDSLRDNRRRNRTRLARHGDGGLFSRNVSFGSVARTLDYRNDFGLFHNPSRHRRRSC